MKNRFCYKSKLQPDKRVTVIDNRVALVLYFRFLLIICLSDKRLLNFFYNHTHHVHRRDWHTSFQAQQSEPECDQRRTVASARTWRPLPTQEVGEVRLYMMMLNHTKCLVRETKLPRSMHSNRQATNAVHNYVTSVTDNQQKQSSWKDNIGKTRSKSCLSPYTVSQLLCMRRHRNRQGIFTKTSRK